MQRLTATVQNYDWGGGPSSSVATLGSANTGAPVDPSKPYSEMW